MNKLVYRIYTEDKNREHVIALCKTQLGNVTITPAIGVFEGERENSLVIEAIGPAHLTADVHHLAKEIRQYNQQVMVLVTEHSVSVHEVIA